MTKVCGILPIFCTDALQHHRVEIILSTGFEALKLAAGSSNFLMYCDPSVFVRGYTFPPQAFDESLMASGLPELDAAPVACDRPGLDDAPVAVMVV